MRVPLRLAAVTFVALASAGPAAAQEASPGLAGLLLRFFSASNPVVLADCVAISKHCMEREYYKALMLCRKLIEYEDERLGNVPSGVSTSRDEG